MGEKAQKKVGAASVLIVGLSGLGVEIAKNVVLAGVKSVSLLDSKPVSLWDMGTNFFVSEKDIGSSRAAASSAALQELNGYVSVNVEDGDISAEMVAAHTMVIMVDCHKDVLLQVNAWAREGQVRRFGVVVTARNTCTFLLCRQSSSPLVLWGQ